MISFDDFCNEVVSDTVNIYRNDKRNRPKRVFHKSATITNYNLIT